MMREVPGLGDREIQLVLDKDKILKFSKVVTLINLAINLILL